MFSFPLKRHALLAVNGHADFFGGFIFLVDDAGVGAGSMKKMAVEAAKVALDAKLLLVGLDAVDAGGLALIPKLGDFLARVRLIS